MSEWISWEEAIGLVARHFPPEMAKDMLYAALHHSDSIKVRVTERGLTTRPPGVGRDILDNPDYPYKLGETRAFFRIEDIELQSLQDWLVRLLAESPVRDLSTTNNGNDPMHTPSPERPAKKRRGGIEKADWDAYGLAFAKKVDEDGYPDERNVKGWQRKADVERWLAELVMQDGIDEISSSTFARHAKALMDQFCPRS